MRARMLGLAAISIASLGLGVACSSTPEPAPATTTSTTTTTAPSKSFAVDTPSGQVSVSLDGKLPPNWPSGFPVAPGSKPAGSGSLGGTDKTVMVGVYTVSGSGEDAFNFYKTNPGLIVVSPSSAGIGNLFAGKLSLAGTYKGSVTVVNTGGQTLTVIVLESPGAGSNGTQPPGSTAPGTTAPGTTVKPATP